MADQEYSAVELDGNDLKIKGQGFGYLTEAGSGEQNLRSLFAVAGQGKVDVQAFMDAMIPRSDDDDT
jgi:hypothetical protein